MGFTVEDMLIIARDKYSMELIAGGNGWANSISWLLMVEDTTIISSFKGKELAVTTGLGFDTEEKLLALVEGLDEHHAAGLIINTGYYVLDVPDSVRQYCDDHDLPLMVAPWDVTMSEMIKDLTVRIFLQTQTDEQISAGFIRAIEHPADQEEYRDTLSASFDVDGRFQVLAFTTGDLDSMDSMDRKRVGYRLQIYLENISHNAHFFYYDGYFLLILNDVEDEAATWIIDGFQERARRRMPDKEVYLGIGSPVTDVSNVAVSYKRATYASKIAIKEHQSRKYFAELGVDKLLYSVTDPLIKQELVEGKLGKLLEYDNKHSGELLPTLSCYLKNNGSVQRVAEEMYIHKNTICYRINKVKELLDSDLEDGEERLLLYLACKLTEELV